MDSDSPAQGVAQSCSHIVNFACMFALFIADLRPYDCLLTFAYRALQITALA